MIDEGSGRCACLAQLLAVAGSGCGPPGVGVVGELGRLRFANTSGDGFNEDGYPSLRPLAVGATVTFSATEAESVGSSNHDVLPPAGAANAFRASRAGGSTLLAVTGVAERMSEPRLIAAVPIGIVDFLTVYTADAVRIEFATACYSSLPCVGEQFSGVALPNGECMTIPVEVRVLASQNRRLKLGGSAAECATPVGESSPEFTWCSEATELSCSFASTPLTSATLTPVTEPAALVGTLAARRGREGHLVFTDLTLTVSGAHASLVAAPTVWTIDPPDAFAFSPPEGCDGRPTCRVLPTFTGSATVRVTIPGTGVDATAEVSP